MCFADILVSLNMIISVSLSFTLGDFMTGEIGCTISGFINILCFVASVMALAAVSLNRYFLVVHWRKYRKMFTRRNTVIILSLVWLFSVLLVIPPLVGWGRYGYHPGKSICFADWSSSISYMLFMIGMCFGGPIASTLFSLYRILRLKSKVSGTLNKDKSDFNQKNERAKAEYSPMTSFELSQTPLTIKKIITANSVSPVNISPRHSAYVSDEEPGKGLPGTPELGQRKETGNWTPKILRRKEKNRAVKTAAEKARREKQDKEERWITFSIVLIVAVFFIAWGPFVVVIFLQTLGKVNVPRWADFGSLFFGCMNSTANPIISLTMNGNFRRAFTAMYGKVFRGYKRADYSLESSSQS